MLARGGIIRVGSSYVWCAFLISPFLRVLGTLTASTLIIIVVVSILLLSICDRDDLSKTSTALLPREELAMKLLDCDGVLCALVKDCCIPDAIFVLAA